MARERTVDEQISELARRYSQRAVAYDSLWSPAIQPLGERLLEHLPLARAEHVIDVGTGAGALLPAIRRAAAAATVLGVDRSEGMLKLARQRHDGPLALMDAQRLDLPDDRFDVGIVAFVLFHLPDPQRCLEEVFRVLKPGGEVGTATWGVEHLAAANVIWDEELTVAGAATFQLPATDNRACCNSEAKMTRLLERAGFTQIKTWTESLEHPWRPEEHFEYQVRSTSRLRLQSLDAARRDDCLRRVRARLATAGEEQYIFRGDVVMATGAKSDSVCRKKCGMGHHAVNPVESRAGPSDFDPQRSERCEAPTLVGVRRGALSRFSEEGSNVTRARKCSVVSWTGGGLTARHVVILTMPPIT